MAATQQVKVRMNLHHLSIFHSIAETGSISAAAKQLHISQPALSHELKVFERRIGVALFERLPRGMRLTEAGEVLHDYASRLFEIARTAESAMREVAGAKHGDLALGASNTIGTYVLPRLLAMYRQANPGVKISLFVGNTEQVSQGVADLRFTLGFIEGPLHVSGLASTQFRKDELVPVVSPGHPLALKKRIAPSDISGRPLLMREAGSGTRELIADAMQASGVEQGPIMEFGNTEALKQAALHGGGVAWLPRICIQQELADGVLRALPTKKLTIHRPLSVVRRPKAHTSPATEAFLKLLHRHAEK